MLLTPGGAGELAALLKSAMKHARDFQLTEELLADDHLHIQTQTHHSHLAQGQPDIVVICLAQGGLMRGKAVIGLVRECLQEAAILVATNMGGPKELWQLLALGAADFVTPPFRSIDLLPRLWRLHPGASRSDPVVHKLKEKLGLQQIVGESPALLAEISKLPAIASCDATVLIAGETGTGKELFARAIHDLSPRSAKPFVPVNCGAIPVDLIENELFGHESGAFTGANSSSVGLVQKTDGGSLFLDEIDCLPLQAQVKLLRFLQEKEFRPVGANRNRRVELRVIAASNTDLEEAVRRRRFRADLFFRLNVMAIALPPLRERKEDIPLLARHFVTKYASASGTRLKEVSVAVLKKLEIYNWPGNIRELENVIQRCVVLCPQTALGPEDIQLRPSIHVEEGDRFQDSKAKMITQFERAYIHDRLREHDGNISRAATAAGKNRRVFWELMRKHQISAKAQPVS